MSDTDSPIKPTPAPAATGTPQVPGQSTPEPLPAQRPAPDPTRYGDWEKNGRCIDF